MSDHTPGPWRVYTNGNGGRQLAIQADGPVIAGINTVETIADLRLKSVSDLPAEANAKLMAKAPSMKLALEAIASLDPDGNDFEALATMMAVIARVELADTFDGMIAPIEAAIAKATEGGHAMRRT